MKTRTPCGSIPTIPRPPRSDQDDGERGDHDAGQGPSELFGLPQFSSPTTVVPRPPARRDQDNPPRLMINHTHSFWGGDAPLTTPHRVSGGPSITPRRAGSLPVISSPRSSSIKEVQSADYGGKDQSSSSPRRVSTGSTNSLGSPEVVATHYLPSVRRESDPQNKPPNFSSIASYNEVVAQMDVVETRVYTLRLKNFWDDEYNRVYNKEKSIDHTDSTAKKNAEKAANSLISTLTGLYKENYENEVNSSKDARINAALAGKIIANWSIYYKMKVAGGWECNKACKYADKIINIWIGWNKKKITEKWDYNKASEYADEIINIWIDWSEKKITEGWHSSTANRYAHIIANAWDLKYKSVYNEATKQNSSPGDASSTAKDAANSWIIKIDESDNIIYTNEYNEKFAKNDDHENAMRASIYTSAYREIVTEQGYDKKEQSEQSHYKNAYTNYARDLTCQYFENIRVGYKAGNAYQHAVVYAKKIFETWQFEYINRRAGGWDYSSANRYACKIKDAWVTEYRRVYEEKIKGNSSPENASGIASEVASLWTIEIAKQYQHAVVFAMKIFQTWGAGYTDKRLEGWSDSSANRRVCERIKDTWITEYRRVYEEKIKGNNSPENASNVASKAASSRIANIVEDNKIAEEERYNEEERQVIREYTEKIVEFPENDELCAKYVQVYAENAVVWNSEKKSAPWSDRSCDAYACQFVEVYFDCTERKWTEENAYRYTDRSVDEWWAARVRQKIADAGKIKKKPYQ